MNWKVCREQLNEPIDLIMRINSNVAWSEQMFLRVHRRESLGVQRNWNNIIRRREGWTILLQWKCFTMSIVGVRRTCCNKSFKSFSKCSNDFHNWNWPPIPEAAAMHQQNRTELIKLAHKVQQEHSDKWTFDLKTFLIKYSMKEELKSFRVPTTAITWTTIKTKSFIHNTTQRFAVFLHFIDRHFLSDC